jgi:hypothetical protein
MRNYSSDLQDWHNPDDTLNVDTDVNDGSVPPT